VTCLVFDNSPLSHFARAGELATLEAITNQYCCVVTQAVLDEIEKGAVERSELGDVALLGWLRVVRVDGLAELQAFAEYANRLGSGEHDIGEASTLAWAEINHAVAVIDERAGARHGIERGVEVHGTLWLIVTGFKSDVLTESDCISLVDALRDSEAWFPCDGATFFEWARSSGLL